MLDVLGTLERTHTCGELRETHVGEQVVLMGWVAKKRDFGVFTFIDLRDRDGMTQVVVSEEDATQAHAKAKNLRGEFVIAVKASCHRGRDAHQKARDGDLEVKVSELLVLTTPKCRCPVEFAGSEKSRRRPRFKLRTRLRRPRSEHRMRAKAVSDPRYLTTAVIEIESRSCSIYAERAAICRSFAIHTGKFSPGAGPQI